jgi:uncharacterized pyridoxamine 5'-phosphate oxidase family protein
MQDALVFLQSRVFYLATIGDGPKIRPMKSICYFEDKIWFEVGNHKNVYSQMKIDPRVSICACNEKFNWIRIEGKAVFDDRIEVKQAMLEQFPTLLKRKIYTGATDRRIAPFFIDDPQINMYNITGPYKDL